MIIIIPISDFSAELFPNIKTDKESLINELKDFYSIGSVSPDIKIENDTIIIQLDIENVEIEQTKYNNLIKNCENRTFEKALPIAIELINDYPSYSEYHRILGQIYSELDNQNDAIDCLIDALKWNPNNTYALIMVGNIFLKYKKDVDTAMIYYNEVLRINPNDYLTLNNIGATLLQLGNVKESKEYFQKAIIKNPDYPNTYIGLAFVYHNENNLNDAFDYALKALNLASKNDEIYKNCFGLIAEIVNKLSQSSESLDIVNTYLGSLESKYDTNIKIEEDSSILTSAKIEIKENYNRDYHLVKYKTNNPAYPHLILHELLHLELIEDAKAIGENSLFISNNSHKSKFIYLHSEFVKTLKKKNVSEESINNYLVALFNGINLQVFNTPIDLFIEDIINTRFKALKPIQFYSLFTILSEGIEATTRKDIVENSPKDILSISKIYNLVNALHFKNLFGLDLIESFKASKSELSTATKFYNEFLEYRSDKSPAEEYELIQHWSEDLNIDGYFDLINENKYRTQSIDSVIDSIKKDPYDLETNDPTKERKMKQFIENHSNKDVNFAVTMYMTDAIPFLTKLSNDEQKKIAFEFATLGMTGIDPNKDGYSVPSIPNKKFTGYQTLAFYYVSWAVGIPDMLEQIQMPFDKEYEIAKQFNNL